MWVGGWRQNWCSNFDRNKIVTCSKSSKFFVVVADVQIGMWEGVSLEVRTLILTDLFIAMKYWTLSRPNIFDDWWKTWFDILRTLFDTIRHVSHFKTSPITDTLQYGISSTFYKSGERMLVTNDHFCFHAITNEWQSQGKSHSKCNYKF